MGIAVNAVAPGLMPTSPDYSLQWESYGREGQRALVNSIAMRRVGEPADIANAVPGITCQALPLAGGPL